MSEPNVDGMLADLAAIASALVDTVSPPALQDGMRGVTAVALRYFNAAACSIAVVDDEAEELLYVAASGAGADAVVGMRLPVGRGIGGWVAQSGQPIAVSDLSRDTRFARDVAESTSYVPNALLAVPIENGERLLGVLSVLDRDEGRADAAGDLDAAALFATQAAAAIEASAVFADAGRIVMTALATAAHDNVALTAVLAAAPVRRRDPDLREFAAVLAELHRCTPEERRLGIRLLREVLEFINRGSGGRSSPSH